MFITNAGIREAVTKMDERNCALLPAGEMGRILDRLALLEQVIGRDHVRQVLEETECFDSRRCRLTREVIFWVVLAMGILTDFAHPPGLQIRAALAARRKWDAASLQSLSRSPTPGAGPGAALVRAYRSPASHAANAGGLLQGLAADGYRRHGL